MSNYSDQLTGWRADGGRVRLDLPNGERSGFVRKIGSGTPMALLHGYPSSSYEWAKVEPLPALAVELTDMALLTGGLYPELHRRVEALQQLADVGHWPPIEAPERIANLVLTNAPVGDG
jgi:pimeloyl-ACP methyl ester carboxylesterase